MTEVNEQTDLDLVRQWWKHYRTVETLLLHTEYVFQDERWAMRDFPTEYKTPFKQLVTAAITKATPRLFENENCGVAQLPACLIEINETLVPVCVKTEMMKWQCETQPNSPESLKLDELSDSLADYLVEFYSTILQDSKVLLYTPLSPVKVVDPITLIWRFGFITRYARHSLSGDV